MTRAGRKTDAATTLLMVLLILTAVKLLLERLLALMLPHDLHQNTRLLLSMAQEALLIGLPALLMRRGRSARTGTTRLSIGLLLCAAVLGLAMRALATPLTQLWGNFLSAPEHQIAAADSAGEWCLQLLALAVLPAALEEALFRGIVLQTLLDSGSRFGAWLLTTLFFALMHGNLAALPAHLLFGGALTLAAMRTGNLLVPMVMHAVYNASALFWRGMSAGWLIFCGAAVLALGIWALMTLPRTAKMRMKRGHIMLSAAILLGLARAVADGEVSLSRKVSLLFTVYEEVGHGGAFVPADTREMISVDMGCVGDDLGCTERMVSICAKDSGGPYNYDLVTTLSNIARELKLDYAIDVYPHYGSDVEATLSAGYDIRHGLIGPGVYASHNYERSHIDGVRNTFELVRAYVQR